MIYRFVFGVLSILFLIGFTTLSRGSSPVVVVEYYSLIDKAEMSIVEGEFQFAIDFYLSANQKLNLFTTDAIRAIRCAVEVHDFHATNIFAMNLLLKGVPHSYFENNYFLKSYCNSREWDELKSETLESNIIPGLRIRIDSLLSRDQEFRFDYDNQIDTIRLIDSLIHQDVLEIFDTYGYPNDDVMGVDMRNDSTINLGWDAFDIILIHQIKNNRKLFIPILERYLSAGQMNRRVFVNHSKNFYPSDRFKLNCLQSVQALIVQVKDELFTCCCKVEAAIDENRKRYFLEPLSELRQKVGFNYEVDSRFRFKGYAVNYDTSKENGNDELLIIKQEILDKGFVLYKKLENTKPYYKRRP